jgi:hypothetical protein
MSRLFFDTPFSTIETQIWTSIQDSLKVADYKLLNVEELVPNLISQHPILIPNLGDDKTIKASINLEDLKGKVYEPNPNAFYGDNQVTSVATFQIPFTGNKDFFYVIPTDRVEVGQPATVNNNFLEVKIRTDYVRLELPEKWQSFVKNTIVEVKKNIESNLKSLENDSINLAQKLDHNSREYLKEKQTERTAREIRDEQINPFR